MKKALTLLLLFFSLFSFSQIGIGTTNPILSAALDLTSTTKGFLFPRMTYANREAIPTPATGLIIWCLDCSTNGELQVYNGISWTNTLGGVASSVGLSAPKITSLKGGNQETKVYFTTPTSNGGNTILSYTAIASPGGLSATGSSSPITITGLTNGTTYTYTVTATNAVGSTTSAASDPLANCGAFTNTGSFLVFGCYNLGAPDTGDPFTYQNGAINGDLYQWGRQTDGHEKRTSPSFGEQQATRTSVPLEPPGLRGHFFTAYNYAWTDLPMDNLWGNSNTKAVNDPCPTGFKVPSHAQWASIIANSNDLPQILNGNSLGLSTQQLISPPNSWTWTNTGYMVGGSLYLPAANFKYNNNTFYEGTLHGYYWTNSKSPSSTRYGIQFNESYFSFNTQAITELGASVRCVQDNNY